MSESKINMSLDQIIKSNKGGNNKRGRGGMRGTLGSNNNRGSLRGNRNRGGVRKLSNQFNQRRGDNKRNLNNLRGRNSLNARRRPRFSSDRRVAENIPSRNFRNRGVYI